MENNQTNNSYTILLQTKQEPISIRKFKTSNLAQIKSLEIWVSNQIRFKASVSFWKILKGKNSK